MPFMPRSQFDIAPRLTFEPASVMAVASCSAVNPLALRSLLSLSP